MSRLQVRLCNMNHRQEPTFPSSIFWIHRTLGLPFLWGWGRLIVIDDIHVKEEKIKTQWSKCHWQFWKEENPSGPITKYLFCYFMGVSEKDWGGKTIDLHLSGKRICRMEARISPTSILCVWTMKCLMHFSYPRIYSLLKKNFELSQLEWLTGCLQAVRNRSINPVPYKLLENWFFF